MHVQYDPLKLLINIKLLSTTICSTLK